jgi:hypothetical protein
LYERIKTYRFDGAGTPGTFRERLAKENGWSPGRAERVIGEYRRFAFLAAAAGHPVSPPPAVDEVWHLHLIHTRAYWEEFCPKVLGKPLHHDPSSGGAGEKRKFADWYARTVESYRRFFGGEPPADLWPRPVARRVTPPAPYTLWAKIRSPFAAAAVAAVGAVAVGCSASGSDVGGAPTAAGILCTAFGFCALAFGLSAVVERRQRRGRGGHRPTFTRSSSGCGSTWTSCGSTTHSGGHTACDVNSDSASDGGSGSSCGSSCGGSSCGGGGGCGGGGD